MTDPESVHAALVSSRVRFASASDVRAAAGGASPDAVVAALVEGGWVEEVRPGTWLVPSRVMPAFDVPRTWGDADPATTCALVALNPNVQDVTRAVLAYGIGTMRRGIEACSGKVAEARVDAARAMAGTVWEGIVEAVRLRAT